MAAVKNHLEMNVIIFGNNRLFLIQKLQVVLEDGSRSNFIGLRILLS